MSVASSMLSPSEAELPLCVMCVSVSVHVSVCACACACCVLCVRCVSVCCACCVVLCVRLCACFSQWEHSRQDVYYVTRKNSAFVQALTRLCLDVVFQAGGRKRKAPSVASSSAAAIVASGSDKDAGPGSGSSASDGESMDDATLMQELAGLRSAWALEDAENMWYYTRVLGGRWTKGNKGVISDGVIACSRSCVSEWCELSCNLSVGPPVLCNLTRLEA